MKRVYSAIGLCAALLIFEAWVFLPVSQAKTDVVGGLLRVPAPPPPNPLVSRHSGPKRPQTFLDASNPPDDNASIDDLMDYWSAVQRQRQALGYNPDPSERSLDRLFKEIDKDHSKLLKLMGSFPDGEKTADFVKGIYDQEGTTGVFSKDERTAIKNWLVYHSPYFSNELYQMAEKAGDTDTYVTNQEELLALARVDFDRARPLIDRLYSNGPDKASRVLARWALYRHAIDTDSTGDIERYRDELKTVVEDKTLSGPMRDLAMDALVSEKEWSGRDEWYTGLMADETLGDLGTYTGLTTLINVSPPEKYVDKMLELLKSDNKAVRTAAVRNLLLKGNGTKPEVIKAMLPWLEDPNWANDVSDARMGIVNALSTLKLPEGVPGLIRMLDEKKKQRVTTYAEASNMANGPAIVAANNISLSSNKYAYGANISTSTTTSSLGRDIEVYAYRSAAVTALGFQADPAAGPALRRVLNEAQGYDRMAIVDALLKCRGFSVPEQVDALEAATRKQVMVEELTRAAANSNSAAAGDFYGDNSPYGKTGPLNQAEIKEMIGQRLLISYEVTDDLVYGVIGRIEVLDSREPRVAAAMREVVMRWPNASVNVLFLRDLKADRADVPSVVRLLAMRKMLRAQFSSDVFDSRAASPTANGIVTCILEDTNDYDAILAADNAEAKTALLACARLIRAPLPVQKVAEYVRSSDRLLAAAAEKYLEAEDSPAARAIVLGLHPGEAKILGATEAFYTDTDKESGGMYRQVLFASVDPTDPTAGTVSPGEIYEADESYPGESEGPYARREPEPENLENTEKTLQDEVRKDADLLGVYAYARQYVRIYKDRVIFSWDEDESRYRERPLTAGEFDTLKFYLTDHHVDELVPFLACENDCTERELIMLGRNGGRRVYSDGGKYEFFNGLDRYFADLKREPGTLKYAMSREIPGLEILMANPDLEAETVWKSGGDLRVAVTDLPARQRVDEEIDKAVEKAEEKDDEVTGEAEIKPSEALRAQLTQKRAFDGISWHVIAGGNDGGAAAQPPGFDLVPIRDGTAIQPTTEQWKARTSNFEIRLSDDSVFKFAAGRLTPILKGEYLEPVVTPNGKWAIVNRGLTANGEESSLVRINLITNRVFPVKLDGYRIFEPRAYIASINKVLVVEKQYYYGGETLNEIKPQLGDVATADPEASEMMLLDPDTGVLQSIVGEMGPLAQQTFRPLQTASKTNEFWAAIPDVEKKTTSVGIYNTNNFGFKPVMQIPKIIFNSMSMWVDEAEGKVYFCYRGHLLSLPLKP